MTAFTYDETHGTLGEVQTVSTLPEGFSGTSHCADVHVSPSGRFIYGSNRGHDSIVIFEIDEGTGKLTYIGHEATQGKTPRNFAIDPTRTFLLAANQDTDTIVTFRINQQTGELMPTGHVAGSSPAGMFENDAYFVITDLAIAVIASKATERSPAEVQLCRLSLSSDRQFEWLRSL